MSKCGYFHIHKGKVSCKHPQYGELFSSSLHGAKYHQCDYCRKRCGGIWPSEVPKEDWTNIQYDVVDKYGNKLN